MKEHINGDSGDEFHYGNRRCLCFCDSNQSLIEHVLNKRYLFAFAEKTGL